MVELKWIKAINALSAVAGLVFTYLSLVNYAGSEAFSAGMATISLILFLATQIILNYSKK